jgi:hypothetical protein
LIRTQAQPVRGRADHAARLRDAALARAAIGDPHLLRAQFVEDGDGQARLRLERLDAPTLAEVLVAERLDRKAAVTMVAGVARAVAVLEANGLVARDLVPERVVLDDMRGAVLAEPGIPPELLPLRRPEPDLWLAYRAPEERLRGELGPRASVYSLGALMIAALSGKEPPARIPQPSEPRGRDLPPTLGSVIARAMADDPERRFPNTINMARAAVQAVRAGERLDAAGATSSNRPKPHVIRRATLTQLAQAPRLVLREAPPAAPDEAAERAADEAARRAAEEAAKRAADEAAKRGRRAARARDAAAKKAAAHAEQERRARHKAERRAAKAAERAAERERRAQAAAEAKAAADANAAAEQAAAEEKPAAEEKTAAEKAAAQRAAAEQPADPAAPSTIRRRRAGAAAAVVGLVGVAAGAAGLAPGESAHSAPRAVRVTHGALGLRLPPGWERAHPRTAPYGGLSDVIAARSTRRGRAVLLVGTLAEPSDTTAALRRLAPDGTTPAAAGIGSFETMRYDHLRPRPGTVASAYLLNTTGASVLIVCEAPPARRTGLDACADLAANLRLANGEALSLAEARARRPAMQQAVNDLAEARLTARERIASATIAERQAAAASDLESHYFEASHRIAAIGLPGAEAERLVSDLSAVGDAYGALAAAIRDGDQVAYDTAREEVTTSEAAVWEAPPVSSGAP